MLALLLTSTVQENLTQLKLVIHNILFPQTSDANKLKHHVGTTIVTKHLRDSCHIAYFPFLN